MLHELHLPSFYKLFLRLCYINNNTIAAHFYLQPFSIIAREKGQPVKCVVSHTTGTVYSTCATPSISGVFLCQAVSIRQNNLHALCKDLYNTSKPLFNITCDPFAGKWIFYPEEPLFSSYGVFLLFIFIGIVICLTTFLFNSIATYMMIKTPELRSTNVTVYACQMAITDLLMAMTVQPLFLTQYFIYYEYLFQGNLLLTMDVLVAVTKWFNHLDFILINSQFVNLAFLSVERCIAISKPFWHMCIVSFKKCLCTLIVIWMYTITVYFLHVFVHNKNGAISFPLAFGVPSAIDITACVCTVYFVRKARCGKSTSGGSTQNSGNVQNQETIVALKLLKLHVIFFACWLPYFACFLSEQNDPGNRGIKTAVIWTKLLSYCHCFLDPMLYALSRPKMNPKVKKRSNNDENSSVFTLHSQSRRV